MAAPARPLPLWASVPFLLLVLVTVLLPGAVQAQLPYLDPMPWHTPADSTSRLAMLAQVQRFTDSHTGWDGNRFLLTALLPAGDKGTFFLRFPHVTFDSGDISLEQRWPWVIGEEAEEGWPGESRTSSFGQLELGATGPFRLPGLGGLDYGLGLGLPMGSDRIYPFSSTGAPFHLAMRKPVALGGRRRLNVSGAYLAHMASNKNNLSDYAFPNGWNLGATLDWYWAKGGRFGLGYDFWDRDGRRSQLVAARFYIPWTDQGAIGLEASREIQGTLDRPATWYFTLTWRLNSARYRAGHEVPPEVVPGTAPP
jgi:hypothetical protein